MSAYAYALQEGARLLNAPNIDGYQSTSRKYEDRGYPQSTKSSYAEFKNIGWENDWMPIVVYNGSNVIRSRWTNSVRSFEHTYDVDAGVIRVVSFFNPPKPRAPSGEVLGLPESHARSDLTCLDWLNACLFDTFLSKGIIRVEFDSITDEDTREVIEKVFDSIKADLQPHPGRTFVPTDGDNFKALLGTADARVFGFLFAEHRKQLGSKAVESIQVVRGATNASTGEQVPIRMTLTIADVFESKDEPIEEKEEGEEGEEEAEREDEPGWKKETLGDWLASSMR